MNCPYCDKFSPSSRMCVHCGETLPLVPKTKRSRSMTRGSGKSSFTKILYVLILIGSIYIAYSLLFKEGNLPSHMIYGSVNLEEMIVKGKTNIVDLYSKFCPPCVQIAPLLIRLDEKRSDIAIVKININRDGVRGIDWQSPVARQFKLRSIPHFIIVSPSGKLKCKGKKAYKFVLKQLREERIL